MRISDWSSDVCSSDLLGFSIDDLKALLELVDRRAVSCAEVRSTAQNHLAAIRKKIADLKRMERVLSETVKSCSGEDVPECPLIDTLRSEEHTSELQSLMRISYAVFCLKKKKTHII